MIFFAPPPAPAPPAQIVAYHDSGDWDADISRVIRRAKRVVRAHLHDHHPAIVLDVDDTSLSSYRCRKAVGFAHGKADCAGPGKMPAIRQTRSLYRYAVRHGVRVFFITGRRTSIRATTIANLHRAGYTGRLHVKLRPVDEAPGSHDGWKARTPRADRQARLPDRRQRRRPAQRPRRRQRAAGLQASQSDVCDPDGLNRSKTVTTTSPPHSRQTLLLDRGRPDQARAPDPALGAVEHALDKGARPQQLFVGVHARRIVPQPVSGNLTNRPG